MTALIVVAGILTGAFVGGCLAMAATFAVVSRSQERMQRKVRYWQAETSRVRASAPAIAQTTARASGQLADPEPVPDRPAQPVPDRPAQPVPDRPAQPVPDRPAQPVPDRPARARREPWVW